MSKREKLFIALFIVAALLFLFSIPVKIARPQERPTELPQVVFHVDREAAIGRYVLEATNVRIAYVIQPIEGTHPAPMPTDSLALCRPYNEGPRYFLRCGFDRYAVTGISLVPKDGK